MLEFIVTEYLDQTKSKDLTVLRSLEFTQSKSKPKLSSATINDFKDLYADLEFLEEACLNVTFTYTVTVLKDQQENQKLIDQL
ncbi:9580_t:CDS:2 [Entrophospora sp. SA101]|nr:9580_t:CDS:2 [Entrophospora sp. SA101]